MNLTETIIKVPSQLFRTGLSARQISHKMSQDLTVLLLSSFADALEKQDVQDVSYLVVTAKLAEQLNQPALAKKYWEEIKAKAQKGTPAARISKPTVVAVQSWSLSSQYWSYRVAGSAHGIWGVDVLQIPKI